jgi:hypothetical protein
MRSERSERDARAAAVPEVADAGESPELGAPAGLDVTAGLGVTVELGVTAGLGVIALLGVPFDGSASSVIVLAAFAARLPPRRVPGCDVCPSPAKAGLATLQAPGSFIAR